jgi:murein L,D-transpeptidase YafK
LFDGDSTIRTYPIALGSTPEGDKEIEGDGKTPEGDFYIFGKNPNSKYFLSLGISYPNTEDADRGERSGLLAGDDAEQIRTAIAEMRIPPQKTRLGGEIYIHGGGNRSDWTQGCIAMTNDDIRELFDILHKGVPVSILP